MDEAGDTHGSQASEAGLRTRRPPAHGSTALRLGAVTASLSAVPADKRKRMAATLVGFAVLFAAIAAVAGTGSGAAAVVCCVIAAVAAALLALIAWGLAHSVRLERSEANVRQLVSAALAASGTLCTCGHDHDPDELHVTDAEVVDGCEHDGAGTTCTRSCDSCVLAARRSSP